MPQLAHVRVKNPIEQDIVGTAGLFRVRNIEKRRLMSVREWHELCTKDELRTPGVHDAAEARVRAVGLARERAPHEVGGGAVEELAQCVVDLRLFPAVDLAEADEWGR